MLAASSLPSPPNTASPSLSPSSTTTDGGQFSSQSCTRLRRPLDRSASDPVASSNNGVLEQLGISGGFGGGSSAFCRYKTELCRPFEENGSCKYADKCQFAHGRAELRPIVRHPKYKTDLCRTYHTTGLCPYGPRCHFIHNDEERQLYMMNRMIIEQRYQEQQRAALMQTATSQQQEQEVLTAALLTQQRLASVQSSTSPQQQQQQVEHVIATSLQRSLSLGSKRTAIGNYDITGSFAQASSTSGNVSVTQLSSCSRGSVDSMSSMDSSPRPTSSNKTISSPSSSLSDVESSSTSSNQRISGDRRYLNDQRLSSHPLSPEHFSYPATYDNSAMTSQARQSCRQQLPSSDTAIMLALLARRVRDAELHSQQQHLNDDFVQAMLAKLQSANGSSTLSGESSNVGRCSDFGLVSEQPSWVLKHGTTATGCDVTRL